MYLHLGLGKLAKLPKKPVRVENVFSSKKAVKLSRNLSFYWALSSAVGSLDASLILWIFEFFTSSSDNQMAVAGGGICCKPTWIRTTLSPNGKSSVSHGHQQCRKHSLAVE